jgi:hypothetical protein
MENLRAAQRSVTIMVEHRRLHRLTILQFTILVHTGPDTPDIRMAFNLDDTSTLQHFVNSGMSEGRIGNDSFNVKIYKDRYPDLRAIFGNNLKSYYLHYISYGAKEGRSGI